MARFAYVVSRRLQARQLCPDIVNQKQSKMGGKPSSPCHIRGVIFDMDGTLTVPVLDFAKLKRTLGISPKEDVLEMVNKLDGEQKKEATRLIEEFEADGMEKFQLQPHIIDLLEMITTNGVKLALVTRNSQNGVDFFMEKLKKEVEDNSECLHWPVFSEVLCRDFTPVKPSPAPVLHICQCWGLPAENVVMVGDNSDDVQSGHRAGAVSIFLKNPSCCEVPDVADIVVNNLKDLKTLFLSTFDIQR